MTDDEVGQAGLRIMEGVVEEPEYCRARGISLRTAQRERRLRQGPPYIRLGKKTYYRIASVRAWLEAREQQGSQRGRR